MKWIGKCILGAIAIAALVFGLTWVTMLLWNWLMPMIFNLTMLTFWQTMGLLVLSKIIFSGFGRKGCGCKGHRGGHWRKRWESKMANMDPEAREKFMQGMNKCGWGDKDNC
jgi:hypothetical protein